MKFSSVMDIFILLPDTSAVAKIGELFLYRLLIKKGHFYATKGIVTVEAGCFELNLEVLPDGKYFHL